MNERRYKFQELQDENAMLKGMNKRYESIIERYENRLKAMKHTVGNLMRHLNYYENSNS
ncbi:MAG: hypothetical protein LVO36_01280 [Nitrosopumilus sp. (ex Thoosa mismalolli)]|nr:hypothetical protein [Nitrosopumilus sp. (ex Thoosa mismalolli)]